MQIDVRRHIHHLITGDGLKARLIQGVMGIAGIQAANRLLALALGILLARTLGAEGYGIYAYAFALMSLLMVAAEAGVPTLLMREVATSHGRGEWGLLRGVLRRAGQFVALTATTISLLGLLVVWGLADSLTQAVLYTTTLMLLLLPLSAGAKTVAYAMRGLQRVLIGAAVDELLRPMLVLMLLGSVFLFWPSWQKPHVAMAAQLVVAMVVLLVGWLILRRQTPALARTARPVYKSRDWLRSALPFTLIGGAGVINSNTDIIMLGWFTGAEEVGIYRVAVQGAALVALSIGVVSAVVAPHFARFYAQGDKVRLQRLVTRSAQVILLTALPIALSFIIAGGVIVAWVFGTEFAAAHTPLAILAGGKLISVSFGLVGTLLTMTKYETNAARILWQTAVLNVVLNVLLIPLFGMNGAAFATAISLVILNLIFYQQVKTKLLIASTAFRVKWL